MNLRLGREAEAALRAEAARTGRSQQELLREAVARYLGLTRDDAPRTETERLIATRGVLPARTSYRQLDDLVRLPRSISTADLLDREDRA
ncbi:MAG: ribbon-helix-helix protein, CopG family [Actinomycetota bacterium]|nr:ribbon-helix-helix protein, CopG family [Actinomycetota bacterium]